MTSDARFAAAIAQQAGDLLATLRTQPLDPRELGRQGDLQANALLLERLAADRPDDAVLSEESTDDKSRLGCDRVWIIDPLDGTREYGMGDRPDWAVHVALWERGSGITAAAVAQPSLRVVYATDETFASTTAAQPMRVLVSASRPPKFAEALKSTLGAELVPMGSAGAKAMAVVRGDAEAYVHAGGQWEWDSAAPVGVALAAGLHCSRADGSPLRYNEAHPYLPDLVICRAELAEQILAVIAAQQPS
ncbi:3'(2'),5'-bisphosphate nucleotidase CysQ [Antrihabitans cavernicola]|uniref:3'(2'),5'-bisphosphate nucleotidase CysQ n=1 Tax=Antrihabitans cavernicola TaxID=2495913 RepID=A0A5A7S6N9_9NOCA|nr:3'(2'),5'-bisphosphate nucleotidase CysQ [Spelaeibacter cavernicola]KAA0018074.1 3'(2'),5'-bisphosphate nucleotidase CysQ [Spelaeibacter cavernicola]